MSFTYNPYLTIVIKETHVVSFYLFSRRKASHLSLDRKCGRPGHQSALENQKRTVPVQQMWVLSQNRKPKNLYVIRPLWLPSLFCSCLDGGKLVNSFSTCTYLL